jgi:uncharacterized phage protein gp47/JayE
MTTNVPPLQFTTAGIVAPTEADILAGVQADINAAFGGNLNPSLSTPQGQLATTLTALIAQANEDFVTLGDQFDPAYASGRMQDAIGRIYFMTRLPALPTEVTCTLTGLAGTVIPVNTQAVDTAGNIYLLTAAVTIPVGGSISAVFNNQVAGAIPCPANTLVNIYKAIPGWDTINNPTDGVIGQDVESRAAFEARRRASVALNSQGMLTSILAQILALPNVVDAYATENNTSSPIVLTGVTLVANSIYICVSGGDSTAIASAILHKKMPGCNMNGTTTVVVEDDNPVFVAPKPTYSIKFQRPANVTIYFAVSIANNVNIPSDAASQIQNAIISAFAGNDGGTRARIGSTIFASRYYSAIANLGSWAEILTVFVGLTASPAPSSTSLLVPIDQIPVTSAGDIAITIV